MSSIKPSNQGMDVFAISSFLSGLIVLSIIVGAPSLLTWGYTVNCSDNLNCQQRQSSFIVFGWTILIISILCILLTYSFPSIGIKNLGTNQVLNQFGFCFK